MVKCSNAEDGCDWKGKLASLEEHNIDCPFRTVPCPNQCTLEGEQVMLLNKDVTTHIATTCSNRLVDCPHCNAKIKQCELEPVHFGKCTKFIVCCPNYGCTVEVEREQLKTHHTLCEYEPVSCKYSHIGCPGRVVRKNKEIHENNHELHLELALEMIANMKLEKSGTHSLMKSTTTQFIATQSHHSPAARYGTVTTFKMSNFEQYRLADQFYCSPPFYSHPEGYKLCVRVYANGTAAGHGTFLSVVVYVMRGENDSNLAWPFNGEVTVELLNQYEDKYHHKKCLRFPTIPCDVNMHSTTGDCNSIGFGYPKFIRHDVLKYSVRPSYMVNNTLFFRVSANATYSDSSEPWLTCTM